MTTTPEKADVASTSVELLLQSIEAKTTDDTHKRILKAARSPKPQESMEAELASILEEQLHED